MITDKPIRLDEYLTGELDPSCGGVVTFAGVVRSPNSGREVSGIFYDCYREMAEREIASVIREVRSVTGAKSIRVIHRVATVPVGEVSMLVAVRAAHRREAFEACQKIIDEVKRRVPIWKKERYVDSTARWL
jgi:molybdopterin synthase catalytic subunit